MQDSINEITSIMDMFPQWIKTEIIDDECIIIHCSTEDFYQKEFSNTVDLLEWVENNLGTIEISLEEKEKSLDEYTVIELAEKLHNHKPGYTFKIKGHIVPWEYYDQNKDFFFIKDERTRRMVLIKKDEF